VISECASVQALSKFCNTSLFYIVFCTLSSPIWYVVRWMLFNWSQSRNSILADEMGEWNNDKLGPSSAHDVEFVVQIAWYLLSRWRVSFAYTIVQSVVDKNNWIAVAAFTVIYLTNYVVPHFGWVLFLSFYNSHK